MKNPKCSGTPKERARKAAISIVCSVVLVASVCSIAALAQFRADTPDDQLGIVTADQSTYAVDFAIPTGGSSTVQPGKTFELTFNAASTVAGTKIACAQVDFAFDKAKVQIDKVVVPETVKGEVTYDNEAGTGLITFYGNDTESVEVCTITFKALDGAEGDAGIAVTSAIAAASLDIEGKSASFTASGAGITIVDAVDISTVGINDPGTQAFTGKAITPLSGSIETANAGRVYEGTDYTVEYRDNVGTKGKTSTATAVVTGIGKYKGTTEIAFDIVSAKTFPDVREGDWYYDVVSRAAALGLVEGYDDGTFGPGDTLTRAQAATILWRYYEPDAAAAYDDAATAASVNATDMADVTSGQWYTAAANWAVASGVISGKGQDNGSALFDPDGNITREELCAVVANASHKFTGSTVEGADRARLGAMPDAASVSSWAVDSVAWSLNNGVISGKGSDSSRVIDPLGQVTRAEMAAVLVNSIDAGLLG